MNELFSTKLISSLATRSSCPREGLDRLHLHAELQALSVAAPHNLLLICLGFEATAVNNLNLKRRAAELLMISSLSPASLSVPAPLNPTKE